MAPTDRTASALLLRLDPLHFFGELPKWTIDSRRPVNRVSRARRAALDAALRLADVMLAAANQRLLNRVQCVPEVRVPILPAGSSTLGWQSRRELIAIFGRRKAADTRLVN